MITPRGFGLLLIVLLLLVFALWNNMPAISLLCLTLLVWFSGTWLIFAIRLRLHLGQLRFSRELRDDRGTVESLWTGKTYTVRVAVGTDGPSQTPYLRASDRVPFAVEQHGGLPNCDGTIDCENSLQFDYQISCPASGRLRFEGVRLQLADVQGFFTYTLFLAEPREYRVLPVLVNTQGHYPTVKRMNLLPLPGLHRHRRPGSGSELLELRDYVPGDPPKMIAWKASARRDRLMTKEFESEVPIRCTLFVDQSASVRVGVPGQNPLARLVQISAAVAQASAAARDLPGLCLFDERGVQILPPARSRRHLIQMFSFLADAAGLPAAPIQGPPEMLVPLAYSLAEEVYPELLQPEVNQVPFWLPLLVPTPAWNRRPPTTAGRVWFWIFFVLVVGFFLNRILVQGEIIQVLSYLPFLLFQCLQIFFGFWFPPTPGSGISEMLPTGLALLSLGSLGLALGTLLFRWFEFVYRALPLFINSWKHRLTRMRKRLAAVIAVRYRLAPGGLALLLEDDDFFMDLVQRFLIEHRVPYPAPLYEAQGSFAFAAPAKIEVLAAALTRAVGRGRDNELFVLLADLLELEERLGPLLGAVKAAIARHHQVIVVCPWPETLPPPNREADVLPEISFRQLMRMPLDSALKQINHVRYVRAFHQLRRAFGKLGVLVLCAAEGDSVPLILDRLDRQHRLRRSRR